MSAYHDTIAALATPVGTAAIALLRISGPDTKRITREIVGSDLTPRSVRHGDYRDLSGALLDDVVFSFFEGPRSYTGEDSLEISCHGNPFIAQKLLEDLLGRGCRAAGAGEFTQRAFLSGRMDLSQAEAVMDLIHARSERALAAANQQLRGCLGRRMGELTDGLLEALAQVEAYIDFPDEDLPMQDRSLLSSKLAAILRDTERLLATSRYGSVLRDGIKTVILGAPNAGKSSLLNRLVGSERALVSPEPGTTRDFIEERIVLGNHGLRLIDTAGLNPSPAPLEKRGIAKTLERAAEADLLLVVLDATVPPPEIGDDLRRRIEAGSTLVVLNKMDLATDAGNGAEWLGKLPNVRVSALTGFGFDELAIAVGALADGFQRDAGEDGVAINARHADALLRGREGLRGALNKLEGDAFTELLASDLRLALDAFGEIVGKIDNESVLDRLFSAFCIGK